VLHGTRKIYRSLHWAETALAEVEDQLSARRVTAQVVQMDSRVVGNVIVLCHAVWAELVVCKLLSDIAACCRSASCSNVD